MILMENLYIHRTQLLFYVNNFILITEILYKHVT